MVVLFTSTFKKHHLSRITVVVMLMLSVYLLTISSVCVTVVVMLMLSVYLHTISSVCVTVVVMLMLSVYTLAVLSVVSPWLLC